MARTPEPPQEDPCRFTRQVNEFVRLTRGAVVALQTSSPVG